MELLGAVDVLVHFVPDIEDEQDEELPLFIPTGHRSQQGLLYEFECTSHPGTCLHLRTSGGEVVRSIHNAVELKSEESGLLVFSGLAGESLPNDFPSKAGVSEGEQVAWSISLLGDA